MEDRRILRGDQTKKQVLVIHRMHAQSPCPHAGRDHHGDERSGFDHRA